MYWGKTNREIASPTPNFFHLVDATVKRHKVLKALKKSLQMGPFPLLQLNSFGYGIERDWKERSRVKNSFRLLNFSEDSNPY